MNLNDLDEMRLAKFKSIRKILIKYKCDDLIITYHK
jgi:hypothetical protein